MKRRNLSKRIAVIAIVAVMTLGMIACGKKGKDGTDTSVSSTSSVSQDSKKSETSATNDEKNVTSDDSHDWPYMDESFGKRYVVETYKNCEDLSDWGVYAKFRVNNNWLYIKYPSLIPTSSNYVAYQADNTIALFMDTTGCSYSGEITDLDAIIEKSIENPEEFSSPIYQMKKYWSIVLEGYVDMNIDSKTRETVGQYDCCKFVGTATHVGDFDKVEHVTQFVGYATFQKSDNTPIYWIVFDESEDQSQAELVAEHAKKMGYTIVEDPFQ